MIKLYTFGPTRGARCLWTLRELDVEFESIEVNLPAGEHRSEAFLAINPMGRVPALVDGDFVMTESIAICSWLADRHPDKGLIPTAGSAARAVHDRWLSFCATELDAPLWRIRRNTVLLPEPRRVMDDIPLASSDFQQAASVFERWLADRPFVVDEGFTVVDIVMTHTLFWSNWSGLLEGLPALQTYMKRHLERPGCPEVLLG